MILLPRKPGESVAIGDDITITVIEVRGDKVRIGVRAPKDASVQRGEECEARLKRDAFPLPPAKAASSLTVTLAPHHRDFLDRIRDRFVRDNMTAPSRDRLVADLLEMIERTGLEKQQMPLDYLRSLLEP